MPICARCGAPNYDTAIICQKCSVPLASQLRGQAGMARQRSVKIVGLVIWLIVLIVIGAAVPSIYRSGNAAYQKFHYESVTTNAIKSCNGPITESTPAYQKAQINDCLNNDEDLQKVKVDYAAFLKGEKR
jgi:ribosomal protein L40E